MDPTALTNWLSGEVGMLGHVTFWVAVAVVGFVIWRAMEWRYRSIFEGFEQRLTLREEKLAYLERQQDALADERRGESAALDAKVDTNSTVAEIPEDRVFVPDSVDPDDLRRLFRDNTSLQAEKLIAPYIGKWLRVECEVENVSSRYGGGASISTQAPGTEPMSVRSLQNIYVEIADESQAAMLRRGDVIQVVGRIESVSAYDIKLHPAEIV